MSHCDFQLPALAVILNAAYLFDASTKVSLMMLPPKPLLVVCLAFVPCLTCFADENAAHRTPVRFEEMKPLLVKYCHDCHSGKEPEGELDLTKLATKADFLANIELTRKIALAIDRREMPPED